MYLPCPERKQLGGGAIRNEDTAYSVLNFCANWFCPPCWHHVPTVSVLCHSFWYHIVVDSGAIRRGARWKKNTRILVAWGKQAMSFLNVAQEHWHSMDPASGTSPAAHTIPWSFAGGGVTVVSSWIQVGASYCGSLTMWWSSQQPENWTWDLKDVPKPGEIGTQVQPPPQRNMSQSPNCLLSELKHKP